MKNMTLERITEVCGGVYYGSEADKKKEIAGAVIDSRQVESGYLFIAVKGEKVDGHQFIPQVFEKGALAVLSEQELSEPAGPYIRVESTLGAMKKLAAYYRRSLDIKVVGITGSVGKTSTKEMIASVLSQKYNVLKTEGNFNNEIGLPLTIFKIREQHEVAVLEMGISEFGEMHRLAEMAYPDICVITNIGLCHLENLLTRDGILKAKTESFEHLTPEGTAVLNGDDDKLCEKKMVNGKPVVFYGIGKEAKLAKTEQGEKYLAEKEVYATDVEPVGLDGTKAVIHIGAESFAVTIPIAGEHILVSDGRMNIPEFDENLKNAGSKKVSGEIFDDPEKWKEEIQKLADQTDLLYLSVDADILAAEWIPAYAKYVPDGHSLETVKQNVQIVMETGKVIAFSLFCVDFDRYDMGGEKTYSSGKEILEAGLTSWKQLPDLV